ncbi:hypothetical protein [Niveispirillum sp. KHB5.9]|uniref:hypothetical protein n=1 Tax=Niveispirillum sp. KHB5.9 TaxID=3400269 RepID=UPI003A8BABB0
MQAFPAGELPYAALLAQLPVAVGGQAGITITALYENMFYDEVADVPFAGHEGVYFVQALDGAAVSAAIGPETNAPIHAAAFAKSTGPVVIAIACRDPMIKAVIGTGKARPGVAAADLGIASVSAQTAAHALVQGCFTRLSGFIGSVAVAHPGRPLVLTGHGAGGYLALALRHILDAQVARAYAFDAPAHGLRAAFLPVGSTVDDRVLEVRSIGADAQHEMEPALGRRLLVDGGSFGFRLAGPLAEGPGRNTRLDRGLRRLAGGTRPEPLVGPLLSMSGDAPGEEPLAPTHPARDLLRLTGAHLGQTGQDGAVLRLARHYDGAVRIDIPGTVASGAAPPARALRFDPAGTVAVGPVPQSTLHVATGRAWGSGTSTILSIQPWDGGAYAMDRTINAATGLLVDNAGDVTADALLSSIFGGATGVELSPVISPVDQLVDAWRQRGAWIDPDIGISVTPDLRPLMRGGILDPGLSLLGADNAAANLIGTLVDGVRAKVGTSLDVALAVGDGGYTHGAALAVGDAGSLLSLCTLATIVRGLDVPGAEQVAPSDLSALLVDAASRIVGGHLGAGPDAPADAAWQAALLATAAGTSDIRLSETWLLSNPIALDGATFGSALAGLTPSPSALTSLAGLLALALQSALAVAPPGAAGTADCTVTDLSPLVEPAGFAGPPEALTASVLGLAGVGQRLVSFIATGLGLPTTGAASINLRHQSGNSGVTLSGGGAVLTGPRPAILQALAARLLAGLAGLAEPVLASLLTRGWVDWLVLAREPRLRTAMPRLPAVYAFFDEIVEVQALLAAQPSATLVPVTRPPMGRDAAIIGGLLYELRRIATDLLDRDGEPESLFNSLVLLATQLPLLGEQLGVPQAEFPPFPPAPATAVQRLQQWLQVTEGLSETVFGYAITNGGVPVPLPLGFTAVQLDTTTSNGAAIGGILVSWTALGPGETALIRWKEKEAASWFMTTMDAQATQHQITSLVGGRTYQVRMARRMADGRESAYTSPVEVQLRTGLENARVAGLKLTGTQQATTWTGRDVAIEWRGAFPASLIDPATGLATTPEAYLSGYVVRVHNATTGALLHEEAPKRNTAYIYTYDRNIDDSRALKLPSACRELLFKVAILPTVGPELGEQSLTVSNPSPPKVQVKADAGVGLLSIEVTTVEDIDLDGYAIWISDQPGFDPVSVVPTYRGPSPQFVQRNLTLGNWYVRAAAVDLFQPRGELDVAGLNLSDEVMVTLADITIDKTPPAVPIGLALESVSALTESGEQTVVMTATWDRNDETDFLLYEVQIREADGPWMDMATALPATGLPRLAWPAKPNTAYTVQVRGLDRSANASAYCADVSHVTARDSTPPGSITDLTADVGLRSAILRWTNPSSPTDRDLDVVEIWRVTRAAAMPPGSRADAVRVGVVRGAAFADSGLSPGWSCWYWLRAIDTSGNQGSWTGADDAGLQVTIPRAVADDVADAAINTAKFASGIEPVGIVNTLPAAVGYTGPHTVMLTTDGKLYRLVSGTWTAAVPAADISGQLTNSQILDIAAAKLTGTITGTQISDGAISTAKLFAGAITTAKIAVGAVTAGEIAVGAVTATKIEAGAVTTAKLAAGAVTADQISANAITAGKVAAGAISANELAAGAITADKIYSSSVTADKIASNAVTAEKILAGSITADKITANAITAVKIAANAVTADKITANAITADKIAANAITADKLSAGFVYAGTVQASQIQSGSITTAQLFMEDASHAGVVIDGLSRNILVRTGVNQNRVAIGKVGSEHGLWVWNAAGKKIFEASDLADGTVKASNIVPESATVIRGSLGVNTATVSIPSVEGASAAAPAKAHIIGLINGDSGKFVNGVGQNTVAIATLSGSGVPNNWYVAFFRAGQSVISFLTDITDSSPKSWTLNCSAADDNSMQLAAHLTVIIGKR